MKKQNKLKNQPYVKSSSYLKVEYPEALEHTAKAVKAVRVQYQKMLDKDMPGKEHIRVAKYEAEFSFCNQVMAFSLLCACDLVELYERYGLVDLMC